MATPTIAFDWNQCIFCQKYLRDNKLNCPADSKRTDIGSGYATLAQVLDGYTKLCQVLAELNCKLKFWDEGPGIEATLSHHRAKLSRMQKCEVDKVADTHSVGD